MHFYAFLLCRCLSLKKYFDISAFTKNIHENVRENVLFQFVLEVRLLIVDLSTGLQKRAFCLQSCPLLFEIFKVPYQIHHLQLSKSYSTN